MAQRQGLSTPGARWAPEWFSVAAGGVAGAGARNRAWSWAVGLQVLTLLLFVWHVATDAGRGLLKPEYAWATIPLLVILVLGTLLAIGGYAWGLGMALGADLWLILAAVGLHFYAAARTDAPSLTGGFTNDAMGSVALAVSTLLGVAMLGALLTGLRALAVERRAVTRRPAATRTY